MASWNNSWDLKDMCGTTNFVNYGTTSGSFSTSVHNIGYWQAQQYRLSACYKLPYTISTLTIDDEFDQIENEIDIAICCSEHAGITSYQFTWLKHGLDNKCTFIVDQTVKDQASFLLCLKNLSTHELPQHITLSSNK